MFNALLVIFVLEVGKQEMGGITTTPFETMAQCEMAIEHAKSVVGLWKYDSGKVLSVKSSMKCFDIPPGPIPAVDVSDDAPQECPTQPLIDSDDNRNNQRWNDRQVAS